MNATHTPCRYEISEGALDVLAITGPEGTRYIDGEDIEAKAIRQQARDLELLTNMLHDQRIVIDDLEHRRGKACDENDRLADELAAAVAERDSALAEIERLNQWFESELIESPESSSAWRQRAEQAEARLAAIDVAPAVAQTVTRPKFVRGEICGCKTRPTHYVGEMDCPWHKRGDGQPKEAT